MLPAARVTDLHMCPIHGGGPIAKGALTVYANGLPIVRRTDAATCAGPPDVIIGGSGTVLAEGLSVSRMTDSTVHGGMIVLGSPNVFVGGPTISGIILEGTPAEQAQLAALIELIRKSGPDGAALIDRLESAATPTRFKIGKTITANDGSTVSLASIGGGGMLGPDDTISGDNEVTIDPTNMIDYTGTDGKQHRETPEGLLAHEAGHADLTNQGKPSHTPGGDKEQAEEDVRDLTNPIREDMGMAPELHP